MRRYLCLVVLTALMQNAWALDWIYLTPNPAYSRDLAMGASTLALAYPPQSQSINPAGFTAFSRYADEGATIFLNPGSAWLIANYFEDETTGRSEWDQVTETTRLIVNSAAFKWKVVTLAGILGQPVMLRDDTTRYDDYESSSSLSHHQNSVLLALNLHRRIAVAGRVDRYYRFTDPLGEGYSYGVILRPKNVELAVQYQRFPASGARVWHPLDRRSDQSVTAGLAVLQPQWTATAQVMNLEQSSDTLKLEPRVGVEWRPSRVVALRAGAASFSTQDRWAWTAGIGILDANWLRSKHNRLPVPDDILQAAVGVLYRGRMPELGIGSLTLSWRF